MAVAQWRRAGGGRGDGVAAKLANGLKKGGRWLREGAEGIFSDDKNNISG
jgi:hypothetical protein